MKHVEKKIEMKLESWQIRMVKDFLEVEQLVDSVVINPGVIQCPASYKIPVEGLSKRDWILYLTDKQMEIVQEQFNLKTPVPGINITEGQIKRGDVVFGQRTFEFELESWQSRIVQDFVDLKFSPKYVIIKPGVIQCPASYKIPVYGLSVKDWLLYLTDKQMHIVQEEFGLLEEVSGINITEAQIKEQEVVFR